MKVIKLPSVLPGDLDLNVINQQLQERTVQLDWSAVAAAPAAALAVLLDGLDQSDDAEVLGFEGAIADTIIQDIITYFNQRPASPKPKKSAQKKPQAQQPEVWEQAEVAPDPPEASDPAEESGSYTTEDETDDSPEAKTNRGEYRVLKTATPFEIRQRLEERILKDLLGPAEGEYEEIDEGRVSDRYLVGLVAPLHRRKRQDAATTATDSAQDLTGRPGTVDEGPEQRDSLPIAGNDTAEDGSTEAGNAVAESMFPSSLGMTFCVSGDAKTIQVTVGWGQYERDRSQTLTTEAGNAKTVWKRTPIRGQSQPLPLQPGPVEDWQIHPDYGVFVRGQIRRQDDDWIVSLFLVNGQTEYDTNPDQSWLFQPDLKVKSGDVSDPEVFIKRAPFRHADHKLDPLFHAEEQDMKMLYRKQVEFAVGHGVGVHATVSAQTPMRAIALETRVVPAYEVPKTTPPNQQEIPALAELEVEMKALTETPAAAIPDKLAALPMAYAQWIADQAALIENPTESLTEHREAANRALERCETALNRIREGIEMLRQNPQAAQAFQFMNRAMYLQRWQSLYAAKVRQGEATDSDTIENPTWFPFQLAFILLNLPSSTDLHHRDRSHETDAIADLLWFPRGGGKTEALPGLSRLHHGSTAAPGYGCWPLWGRWGSRADALYPPAADPPTISASHSADLRLRSHSP
jgi:hypothetical protein